MNLIPWPRDWVGTGPATAWMKRFLARCKQEVFLESKDFRRVQTNGGYFIESKSKPSAGGKGQTLDANYKMMVITQLGSSLIPPIPDLLICQGWNWLTNTASGQNVYVAKDTEARQAVDKEFYYDNGDNVTQTYTYFTGTAADATYGDNFRMASDGTHTEVQSMEKRYYTNQQMISQGVNSIQAIVWVIDTGVPTGVKDPLGNDVTHLEVKPIRAWAKFTSQ